MDIQKYIQSGILDNYALGLLSDVEKKEVEKNLIKFPELKTELHHIEDALAIYAQAKAIPMPKGLSEQILESIENLDSTPSNISDTTPRNTQPQPSKSPILLGTLLGLSLLGSLLLFKQKHDADQQLITSQSQISDVNNRMLTLQLDCDAKDQTIQRLHEQLQVFKSNAYQPIFLKGTDKSPESEAIVYFNTLDKKTYLDIGNLPTTPMDKDYQLWAIVDGAPTDMGVIDLATATEGLIEVPYMENPQAFAVTLETKGGNPTPNLDELYVIGNVES